MKKLSAKNAFELSNAFGELSASLNNYLFSPQIKLTKNQKADIESCTWSLLNASADIRTFAVDLQLDESKLSFEKLLDTTAQARDTIRQLTNIRKVIVISTAAVSLAGAIISQRPGAIIDTTEALYKAIIKA